MARRESDNPRAAGPADQKIGARIRARRLDIGMSQEALASKLSITFQQVQKYEKGVNRVAATTLVEIADALGIAATELLPRSSRVGAGANPSDDHETATFMLLLADLNADGKRVLAGIARSLARDPKLGVMDKRRRD